MAASSSRRFAFVQRSGVQRGADFFRRQQDGAVGIGDPGGSDSLAVLRGGGGLGGLRFQRFHRGAQRVFGGQFRFDPRLVVGAFRIGIAVDEFDDRHRRHVAIAEACLEDADIAAQTVLVTRAEHVEELGDMLVLLELSISLAAFRAGEAPEIPVVEIMP